MTKPRAHPENTWIETAVRNAGIRKAMTGLTWAYCWAIARQSIGHSPSVEEVADWWTDPYRTAYRNQAAFRAAFPDLDTPAIIFESPEANQLLDGAYRAIVHADRGKAWRKSSLEVGVVKLGLLSPPG